VSLKFFCPLSQLGCSFLLLKFKCTLYIFDNSQMSFENVLSRSVTYTLILLTVVFEEQKTLILMKFSISIVSFLGMALVLCRNVISAPKFSLQLSSNSFKILHFTFRSVIHCELSFVGGLRSASRFSVNICISTCFHTTG
jgi:hypothetical protein